MDSGILVRTDASVAVGTGHSMRCLALAQLSRDLGLRAALVYGETTSSQLKRWQMETFPCTSISAVPGSSEDASITARLSRELHCAWVVIDGYRFGTTYQRQLKAHGCRVLCIDDYVHAEHYCADVVLNQTADADADRYGAREPFTRLLLGSRYALLRREFLQRAHNRQCSVPQTATRLLVTLGGSDPQNATAAVIASLRLIEAPVAARVVIGGSRLNVGLSIDTRCEDAIEIIHDATNVAELMAWAEIAVAGAGVTSWELAFMGVPSLTMVLADNQTLSADCLDRHGAAINVGRAGALPPEELARILERLAADHEARNRMCEAGHRLVDGYGAYRVLQAIGLATLRLARASESDSRLLWEWANEPAVRRFSFTSDPIAWETHREWYARKLSDPNSSIWIAYDSDDEPVGQIRFACRGENSLHVSVSVPLSRRGSGYGRKLIEAGLRHAARAFPGRQTHALIKRDNVASIRAFQGAGFTLAGEETIEGHPAFHYVWQPLMSEFA